MKKSNSNSPVSSPVITAKTAKSLSTSTTTSSTTPSTSFTASSTTSSTSPSDTADCVGDGGVEEGERFWPAYMLSDWTLERAGRCVCVLCVFYELFFITISTGILFYSFLSLFILFICRGKSVVSDAEIIDCPPEKKNIRSDVRTAGTYIHNAFI